MAVLEIISSIVGGIGIGIVVWGVLLGFLEFIVSEFIAFIPRGNRTIPFEKIRAIVGRYLLLGLEFLVASAIIRTIIQPTLEEVIILAFIVGIRTVLAHYLTREIERYEEKARRNPQ